MSDLHIPLATAGAAIVLALMQVVLMVWVAAGRAKFSTGLGHGGHDDLLRRIRMHGNLAENVPLFLVLLGLVETLGNWRWIALAIAAAFVCVRVSHVIGLTQTSGSSTPRIVGALGTAIILTVLAALLAVAVAARALHA